ncbi:hypothetical protein C2E20_8969 [Micractinium conductrix]|uniref:Peptidase M11 gametolysin domain-containing protein n=1 Tax=Micractinium conductrix TaxID=554055 RepID=A0A2P6UZT1_9CHLO|nr:hypothetical protein C2E20_8969 [Micractinium conductrix]|eukprot:PSC67339.1 hypothetical protein C2E20_8969 [Micractinium conductrix]
MLAVETDKGRRVLVQTDPAALEGLHTGMKITVSGVWGGSAARRLQQQSTSCSGASSCFSGTITSATGARVAPEPAVQAPSVIEAGNPLAGAGLPVVTNQLINPTISTLVIPIAATFSSGVACSGTSLPTMTRADIQEEVFSELAAFGTPTVAAAFNRCSYQRSRLNMTNSNVTDIVRIPCSGTNNSGAKWTASSTCSFDDFNGMADAADTRLRQLGINLNAFRYKVYLTPPGTCDFVGQGYVGCDGSYSCRAWIGFGMWGTPQAIVHEIGHNMFMKHSGAVVNGVFDDYADDTCTMGYCCQDRCWNTPHGWQMGWTSAVQVNGTSLPAGSTITITVGSQSVYRTGAVRILPATWASSTLQPIFMGLRTKNNGDLWLEDNLKDRVHIYNSNIQHTFDPQPTRWIGSLAVGQAYSLSAASLVVRRMPSTNSLLAVLAICRRVAGGAETQFTCTNGIDGDCNGQRGYDDVKCRTWVTAPV